MKVKFNFEFPGTITSLRRYLDIEWGPDMKNSLTNKAALIIVTGLTFMASACNTIEGVGKDLESAGDKAEEVTKK